MLSRKLIVLAMIALPCFGQATANGVFSEQFNGANTQWTIGGTGVTYSGTTTPGMSVTNATAGQASAPWSVGSSPFTLTYQMPSLSVWQNQTGLTGMVFGISTGIPGSMTSADYSYVVAITKTGFYCSARTGDVLPNSGGAMAGTDLSNLGTGGSRHFVNGAYSTIAWPVSSSQAAIPQNWNWWVTISRDGSNNATFSIFTDQFQGGTVAYYSGTWAITSTYRTKSIANVWMVNETSGGGGNTLVTALVNNIYGYTSVTGGTAHTVTSIVPSGISTSDETFQSGNQITITGTNFNCASSTYIVNVGAGNTLQTATATCVNATTLTVALPTETNSSTPYEFSVSSNGIIASLQSGITYSPPVVYSMDPHEVPLTPANSADGTITITGCGFDSSTNVAIGGNPATVTLVDACHLSVVVPAGSAGLPAVLVKGTGGVSTTTIYDSTSSGTYPPAGKVNFGYAPHPYMHFTPTTLTAILAKYSNPAYVNYRWMMDAEITPPLAYTSNPLNQCPSYPPTGCTSGYTTQTTGAYGYHYLLAQDSASLAAFNSAVYSVSSTSNDLGLVQLAQIAWGANNVPFNLGTADTLGVMYDALFPTLTPAQRILWLNMLDSACNGFYYMWATQDANTYPAGNSWDNRIAVANGGGGSAAVAVAFSLAHLKGYTTASPWLAITGVTLANDAVSSLVTLTDNYGNNEWLADGTGVEGAFYSDYGGIAYLRFADAVCGLNTYKGTSPCDQGTFSTHFSSFAAWAKNTLWNGFNWDTWSDTQPQYNLLPSLIFWCQHSAVPQACFMADTLAQQVAANQLGGLWINTMTVLPASYSDSFYDFIWRDQTNYPGSFTSFPTLGVQATGQQARMRSNTNWDADFSIALKGKSANEDSDGHNHPDQGGITMNYQDEWFLIDPGYEIPAAANHSILIVDGVSPTISSQGTHTATIDTTQNQDANNWHCATVNAKNAYLTDVTLLRRNVCLYANLSTGVRVGVVLDDIAQSGAGSVQGLWQTGRAVSNVTSAGFQINGYLNTMFVRWFGPTSSSGLQAVSLDCSTGAPSWAFCQLQPAGISYSAVQDAYTDSSTQPRVTCFSPQSVNGGPAAATCSVTYTSGTVTLTLSNGAGAVWTNGTGTWNLSSVTP